MRESDMRIVKLFKKSSESPRRILISATRVPLTKEVMHQLNSQLSRPMNQARQAPGFRGVKIWSRGGYSYMVSGWVDEVSLNSYRRSGAHQEASRRTAHPKMEAVRWMSEGMPSKREVRKRFRVNKSV